MLTKDELHYVWQWMRNYPSVNEWGWKNGPLTQQEALVSPGYG